jgi:hypothetical protein
VTKFHPHTKQQAKLHFSTHQYLFLTKCTCGTMSCYRTVHSAVCPYDCHSESISLRVHQHIHICWFQIPFQIFAFNMFKKRHRGAHPPCHSTQLAAQHLHSVLCSEVHGMQHCTVCNNSQYFQWGLFVGGEEKWESEMAFL